LAGVLLSPALRHAAGAPGARRHPGGAVALPTPPWAAPSPGACAGARSQAAGAPPSACRPRGGVGGAGRAALAVRPPAGAGAAVSPLPRSGPAHAHPGEPLSRGSRRPGPRLGPGGGGHAPRGPWAPPTPRADAATPPVASRMTSAGARVSRCATRALRPAVAWATCQVSAVGRTATSRVAVAPSRPPNRVSEDRVSSAHRARPGRRRALKALPPVRAGVQKDGTPPAPLRSRWT